MKKIFIDLGCYDGDSVRQFYGWGSLVGDPMEYDIYAFDPSPRWEKVWRSMESENERLRFEQKAAYTYDGEIQYTLRPFEENGHDGYDLGSTVVQTKADWGRGEILTMPCFDFSTWLKQFRGDEVIIKMDIEGAEYEVLEKMIEDGTDDIPNLIMVEWHGKKRSDNEPGRQDRIIEQLRCEVKPWY